MAKKEPVTTAPKDTSGEKPLRIRRGRIDSVDIFEIKDSELDLLEKGSPIGLYLNFAIFLVSIAFSALATLCTSTTFIYPIVQIVFVVVMVVGFLMGAFLIVLWRRGRGDVAEVIKGIRDRIPLETASDTPSEFVEESRPEEQPKPAEPKG